MRINLTDNNIGLPNAGTFQRKKVAPLFSIAGKTIASLCEENEGLLIFPYNIENSDDRIGESSIMHILNTDNPEVVSIATGNIMGFIGIGDLKVKIKSRFDVGRDDYFLHYMLQKVLSFNLFDLNHNNEQEDVFDFVLFMFPYFLKTALRQGLYREYQTIMYNDSNLRGSIDVGRYVTKNVPFVGKFSYTTREYSYDNTMTQLIRHTIEFMRTKKYGRSVLGIDSETLENVNVIIEHTPSYNKNQRSNIINKNLRVKAHPYYTEYHLLQKLCIQILRMEEVKYGQSEDEICGILFDGAWLWEEYLNTILQEIGFTHPQNKKRQGGIYLFADNSGERYPDFYNADMVLDAKYKRLGSLEKVSEVDEDDIHQVMVYMDILKKNKGGFVAPLEHRQEMIPTSRRKDTNSTLSIYGIEISKTASSYVDFCNKMKKNEAIFVKTLMKRRIGDNGIRVTDHVIIS